MPPQILTLVQITCFWWSRPNCKRLLMPASKNLILVWMPSLDFHVPQVNLLFPLCTIVELWWNYSVRSYARMGHFGPFYRVRGNGRCVFSLGPISFNLTGNLPYGSFYLPSEIYGDTPNRKVKTAYTVWSISFIISYEIMGSRSSLLPRPGYLDSVIHHGGVEGLCPPC